MCMFGMCGSVRDRSVVVSFLEVCHSCTPKSATSIRAAHDDSGDILSHYVAR
jgi:hypothetical protein